MSQDSRGMEVLKKLLKTELEDKSPKTQDPNELVSRFLTPTERITVTKTKNKVGRPIKAEDLKAKNFTLCLDPKYLRYLDNLKVPIKKVQGRGRKIRFIIDQFIFLKKKEKHQLEILISSLNQVDQALKKHSDILKKGERINLSAKDKEQINQLVSQVETLFKIIGYTPKELYKILNRKDWAMMSFCLEWRRRKEERL